MTCTDRQGCSLSGAVAICTTRGQYNIVLVFPDTDLKLFIDIKVGGELVTKIVAGSCWLCVSPPPPRKKDSVFWAPAHEFSCFLLLESSRRERRVGPRVALERCTLFPELPLPHSWADWDLGLLCRSIVLTQQHHRPGPSKPQLPSLTIVVLRPGGGYLCLISHPSLFFSLTHFVILDSDPLPQPFCIFARWDLSPALFGKLRKFLTWLEDWCISQRKVLL